jgi:DnaJ family protein C protein 2
MWAKKKPVPNLGDDKTPIAEVKKFYKFWDNFQSWREFSQYDEYVLDEAQDRYERRYMDKENKKLRSEHEKKERARLITLSERSYNNDPRIKREREEDEAQKQIKKD